MKTSFYAYLSKLRWIKRWGLKRNAHDENVMEHSWEIAVISHILAVIKNQYFDGNIDENAVATAALYHDVTEVITGDLPTPIKYHSAHITKAYKQIEKEAEDELIDLLPIKLKKHFVQLIKQDEMIAAHKDIIKAADRIGAYLKCQAEIRAGNKEFEIAAKQIGQELKNSKQEEVIFFMTNFVPSCGLTLDDLMKIKQSV